MDKPQPQQPQSQQSSEQQQQGSIWASTGILTPNGGTAIPVEMTQPPVEQQQQQARLDPVPGTHTQPTPQDTTSNTELVQESPQEPRQASEAFVALNKMLKDEIGYSVEDLIQTIQAQNQRLEQFQPVVQQYSQQQQLNQLQTLWGVDGSEFQRRLSMLRQYSEQLTPQQIQEYDSMGYNGLDLLYRRIADSQRPSVVPMFDRPSGFSPPQNNRLTEEQIQEQLKNGNAGRNWQSILQHYSGA